MMQTFFGNLHFAQEKLLSNLNYLGPIPRGNGGKNISGMARV
jgi:hypothetical protein